MTKLFKSVNSESAKSDLKVDYDELGSATELGPAEISAALASRFVILDILGAGQSCTYYLARNCESQEPVRLKVFGGTLAPKAMQPEMFRLEAEASARLLHENIVRSGQVQELNGVMFSVEELTHVIGSLRETLDRNGWLDIRMAVGIAYQIANALHYAHELGILHLKLQPDCIHLVPDGSVLISDFGVGADAELAWAHRHRTKGCAPQYISPEQARGMRMDQRSDLYSLGVILFEMLTDRVPFDSDDPVYITERHARHSPLLPHVLSAAVPSSLSNVVMGLLERNPEKRFPSAAAVLTAMSRLPERDLVGTVRMEEPAADVTDQNTDPGKAEPRNGYFDQTSALPNASSSEYEPRVPMEQTTGALDDDSSVPIARTVAANGSADANASVRMTAYGHPKRNDGPARGVAAGSVKDRSFSRQGQGREAHSQSGLILSGYANRKKRLLPEWVVLPILIIIALIVLTMIVRTGALDNPLQPKSNSAAVKPNPKG